MRVHLVVAALVLGGCGTSATDVCRDECAKLNACAQLDASTAAPSNCDAQCQDFGVTVYSMPGCDFGATDDCINAITPSGSGSDAVIACERQVTDCSSQHCAGQP